MRLFRCPVFDQSGKEMIVSGKVMDGKELKGINFCVKAEEGPVCK